MKNVQKINGEIMSQNTYSILKEMELSGIIKECLKKGIVSLSLFGDFIIYKRILLEKLDGKNMTDIVMGISIDENIHRRTVYKIKKRMEY